MIDSKEDCRSLVRDFVLWCHTNHLQLKTEELVLDYGKSRPRPGPVKIEGAVVDNVISYNPGLWMDNKLNWASNTDHLYRKAQSSM